MLVIAHHEMNEYHAFADLAEKFAGVHLDTPMAGTDFTERFAPLPADYVPRLGALGDKVVLGADVPNIPYPYAEQISALDRIADRGSLGEDWLRRVLWTNGARVMGLDIRDR